MSPKNTGPGGARGGAGRPPLGPDARSETVRVRMRPALRQKVAAAAAREGQSESEWGEAAFDLVLARGDSAQVAALKERVAELEGDLATAGSHVAAIKRAVRAVVEVVDAEFDGTAPVALTGSSMQAL